LLNSVWQKQFVIIRWTKFSFFFCTLNVENSQPNGCPQAISLLSVTEDMFLMKKVWILQLDWNVLFM